MGFEVFEKASAPVKTVPSVTIQRRGMVSLNAAAHQMMGEPKALMFLWDAERRVIGLQACDVSDPNGYPVRSTGSTPPDASNQKQTRAKRGKAVLVAGSMFTQYIGLDTSEARRWVPQLEGNVLIVDLNSESQRVVSNRSKAREAAANKAAAKEDTTT